MAVELPEPLQWVLLLLAGTRWPEADEDQLREMADHWRKAGQTLEDAGHSADAAMKRALEGQKGAAAEALTKHWAQYTTGKGTQDDPGYFPGLVQACNGMGDMLEAMANSAETAKIQIIAQLGILAFDVATAEAEAPVTFGASMAQVPIVIGITREAVGQILKKLLAEALEHAVKQAVQMAAINLMAQTIELMQGHRKSIDMKEVGQNALGGAVSGAAGNLIGKGLGKAGTKAGLGGAMESFPGKLATGAAVGVGTDATTQLVTTGHVDSSSLLGSGLSGAGGVGVHAGAAAAKDHFNGPDISSIPHGSIPHGGEPPTFSSAPHDNAPANTYRGPGSSNGAAPSTAPTERPSLTPFTAHDPSTSPDSFTPSRGSTDPLGTTPHADTTSSAAPATSRPAAAPPTDGFSSHPAAASPVADHTAAPAPSRPYEPQSATAVPDHPAASVSSRPQGFEPQVGSSGSGHSAVPVDQPVASHSGQYEPQSATAAPDHAAAPAPSPSRPYEPQLAMPAPDHTSTAPVDPSARGLAAHAPAADLPRETGVPGGLSAPIPSFHSDPAAGHTAPASTGSARPESATPTERPPAVPDIHLDNAAAPATSADATSHTAAAQPDPASTGAVHTPGQAVDPTSQAGQTGVPMAPPPPMFAAPAGSGHSTTASHVSPPPPVTSSTPHTGTPNRAGDPAAGGLGIGQRPRAGRPDEVFATEQNRRQAELDQLRQQGAGKVRDTAQDLGQDQRKVTTSTEDKFLSDQKAQRQAELDALRQQSPGSVKDSVHDLGKDQAYLATPPQDHERLVHDLPGMSEADRLHALDSLSGENRRWLARNPTFVDKLHDTLPPREFAKTAAHLMVHVDDRVTSAPSARAEARTQVERMLQDPDTAAQLLKKGASVVVVPKDVPMTGVNAFHKLAGTQTHTTAGAGRSWDEVRGSGGRSAAVTEENLTGDHTTVGVDPNGEGRHYADGYSTTTHEFAHTVHDIGLSDADRKTIADAYQAKFNDPSAVWPDGTHPDNYSRSDDHEYFAQATNAWLGTNHGTDPDTHEQRNNGPDWVRTHEPALVPLLEKLYGADPAAIHSEPANQVRANTGQYEDFREFWHGVDEQFPDAGQVTPAGQHPATNPLADPHDSAHDSAHSSDHEDPFADPHDSAHSSDHEDPFADPHSAYSSDHEDPFADPKASPPPAPPAPPVHHTDSDPAGHVPSPPPATDHTGAEHKALSGLGLGSPPDTAKTMDWLHSKLGPVDQSAADRTRQLLGDGAPHSMDELVSSYLSHEGLNSAGTAGLVHAVQNGVHPDTVHYLYGDGPMTDKVRESLGNPPAWVNPKELGKWATGMPMAGRYDMLHDLNKAGLSAGEHGGTLLYLGGGADLEHPLFTTKAKDITLVSMDPNDAAFVHDKLKQLAAPGGQVTAKPIEGAPGTHYSVTDEHGNHVLDVRAHTQTYDDYLAGHHEPFDFVMDKDSWLKDWQGHDADKVVSAIAPLLKPDGYWIGGHAPSEGEGSHSPFNDVTHHVAGGEGKPWSGYEKLVVRQRNDSSVHDFEEHLRSRESDGGWSQLESAVGHITPDQKLTEHAAYDVVREQIAPYAEYIDGSSLHTGRLSDKVTAWLGERADGFTPDRNTVKGILDQAIGLPEEPAGHHTPPPPPAPPAPPAAPAHDHGGHADVHQPSPPPKAKGRTQAQAGPSGAATGDRLAWEHVPQTQPGLNEAIKETASGGVTGHFAEPAADEPHKTGYVGVVPTTLGGPDLVDIANRYREGFSGDPKRFALVIGVNAWEGTDKGVAAKAALQAKVDDFKGKWNDPNAFPVGVVGFTWGDWDKQKIVTKDDINQKTIPYGQIRQHIVKQPIVTDLVNQLTNLDTSHVYLHVSDDDTSSFRTPGGDPLFDSATSRHLHGDNPPDLLSGGYAAGAGEERTVRLANKLDLSIRDAMAKADPRLVYFPEPNTFAKVLTDFPEVPVEKTGLDFGTGSQEGQHLVDNVVNRRPGVTGVAPNLKFDQTLAVETSFDRIGENVPAHPGGPVTEDTLKGLYELTQTHAKPSTWWNRVESVYPDAGTHREAIQKFVFDVPPVDNLATEAGKSAQTIAKEWAASDKALYDAVKDTDRKLLLAVVGSRVALLKGMAEAYQTLS